MTIVCHQICSSEAKSSIPQLAPSAKVLVPSSSRYSRKQAEYNKTGRRTQQLQRRCKRDPLEVEIWNSWQSEVDEWETENFTEDELVDILFEVSCSSLLYIRLSVLRLLRTRWASSSQLFGTTYVLEVKLWRYTLVL